MTRSRTIFKRFLLAIALINIAVAVLAWYSLHQSRQSHEDRARVAADNLSELLMQNITGIVQRVDMCLRATVNEIDRQTARGGISSAVLNQFISSQHEQMPELDSLRFADEAGVVRYGVGVASSANITIADREYFNQLRGNVDAGLVLSKPILGKISGQWVVVIGRRYNKSDGSFGGVVYAAMRLSRFQSMFESIAVGSKGVVSLRAPDLGLVSRYPVPAGPDSGVGNKTVSADFQESLRLNPSHGSYIAPTGMDGINRTISYRRMETYPGYIIVGLATDDYLQEWLKEVHKLTLITILFFLATLITGSLLWRAWKRQAQYVEALESSRESLYQAQRIANIGQYNYDLQTDQWGSSSILDEIFGIDSKYPRDARHWQQLVFEDSQAEILAYLKTVVEQRIPFDREYRIVRPADGATRWVHGKGNLQFDSSGTPVALVGTIQDITESKLAQEQIKALLEEQGLIFDNAHVGIVMVRQRQIIKCNNRLAEMFGYVGPTEIEGKLTEIFYCSSDEFNDVGTRLYAMMAQHGYAQQEVELRRRDGQRLWILLSGRPLDPKAVAKGSIWIYTDVSEHRKAEEELRIAAAAFDSQEGMVVTDANGVILRVNRAFTQITGYEAKEVIGQNPRILKSSRHDADFFREMWQALIGTGSWQGEIWDRRKNGEEYPKWLSISAVKDKAGSVTHYIGSHFDITERKQAEERIKDLAFSDQLTGLPNRHSLHERLAQILELVRRNGKQLALMLIDLDNFKSINDTLGHHMGDQLLVQVASRLSASVRHSDLVARLGGDEFVVVLPEIDMPADAAYVADKIVQSVSNIYSINGQELHSSPSIGICLFPEDASESEDLIKKADVAMYHAKSKGKGNYQFFREEIQVAALKRLSIEADLRTALTRNQFVLHYQPQLDLRTGGLVGVEALLRWKHPSRGLVSPLEFIPIAEESGLIIPIGDWVLKEACKQVAQWRDAGLQHIKLSVNLSASQFLDRELPDRIDAVLRQYDLKSDRLDLEVTESMSMASPDDTIVLMKKLRQRGLSLSIDDFGTGYSSLAYLKLFPINTLKIDRSFVKDIETDKNDADICDVTVLLAHKLGLDVVAEGVETEAQFRYLHSIGCEKIQGYLISKPLPAHEAETFLRTASRVSGLGTIDLWNGN